MANDMRADTRISVRLQLRSLPVYGSRPSSGYTFLWVSGGGSSTAPSANERITTRLETIGSKGPPPPEWWDMGSQFRSSPPYQGPHPDGGINLRRTIRGKNEYAYIAPLRPEWGVGAFFRASSAATLIGLEVPTAGKNLEIKPYAVARLTTDMLASPAVRNDWGRDAGADVKYGVTKSLTADLTYKRLDQVESMSAVDLRVSICISRERDFFLEGQGSFRSAGVVCNGGGLRPPCDTVGVLVSKAPARCPQFRRSG